MHGETKAPRSDSGPMDVILNFSWPCQTRTIPRSLEHQEGGVSVISRDSIKPGNRAQGSDGARSHSSSRPSSKLSNQGSPRSKKNSWPISSCREERLLLSSSNQASPMPTREARLRAYFLIFL